MAEALQLSVIIPTHNRADVLARALAALDAQTAPADVFEILVCDDGSRDRTSAVLAAYAVRTRRPFRALSQPNAGANAARNNMIRIARGELLLILNDDSICGPDLVERHLDAHRRHADPTTAVLGRMTVAPELPPSLFAPLHHDASYALVKGHEKLDWWFFFTCNVSVPRAFVLEAGGFDERLRWHEDIELGERLSQRGLRLFYEPAALARHWHLLDEAGYLRIAEREGASLVAWLRKRPDLYAVLCRLGLSGKPFARSFRHRLADAAMPRWSLPLWRLLARGLARISPAIARAVYRRLFQRLKRLAIADEARRLGVTPPEAPS